MFPTTLAEENCKLFCSLADIRNEWIVFRKDTYICIAFRHTKYLLFLSGLTLKEEKERRRGIVGQDLANNVT